MFRRKILPNRSWSVLATCDVSGLGSSSSLSSLPATDHLFLLGGREGDPCRCVVLPLLEQEDAAALARGARLDGRDRCRLDQRRVLAAVDETGQIQIAVVRPADRLMDERRVRSQCSDDAKRDVEHDVIGRAGQPDDDIVLRRGEGIAISPDDRLVEAREPPRHRVGSHRRPELRSKAGDEVDSADRRPRFSEARHQRDQLAGVSARPAVEFEVRVRHRAKREDAGLGRRHPRRISASRSSSSH